MPIKITGPLSEYLTAVQTPGDAFHSEMNLLAALDVQTAGGMSYQPNGADEDDWLDNFGLDFARNANSSGRGFKFDNYPWFLELTTAQLSTPVPAFWPNREYPDPLDPEGPALVHTWQSWSDANGYTLTEDNGKWLLGDLGKLGLDLADSANGAGFPPKSRANARAFMANVNPVGP
jgi:hypothetical protein